MRAVAGVCCEERLMHREAFEWRLVMKDELLLQALTSQETEQRYKSRTKGLKELICQT